MSDQQIGEKEIERMHLQYFMDAYKDVTGLSFTDDFASESPDFICKRSDGNIVGIELVWIMGNYELVQFEKIVNPSYETKPFETLENIYIMLKEKDEKRARGYGDLSDKTILVMELHQCSLFSLNSVLTSDIKGDFSDFGFFEIWLADFTEIEAYGDVELFGLYPDQRWGYHRRIPKKPFG